MSWNRAKTSLISKDHKRISKDSDAADSCSGRCGDNNSNYDCQCNSYCERYNDCCANYYSLCKGAQSISRSELSELAQELWDNDANRLSSSQYEINLQTKLSNYGEKVDRSSSNFFTSVNTWRLGGTFDAFQDLLDNYVLKTGTAESVSSAEGREMEAFLDDIMATTVMQRTYSLLQAKGYFSSLEGFRDFVNNVWFTLYSRSSNRLDSSAFEHTFVGEVKNSAVSGFHNWLQFYYLEQDGRLNYYGYVREANPNQILLQFSVDGYVKTLSSIMLGVSPEFELALYSVCFVSQPNSLCRFDLEGNEVQIQTYDYTGGYIGSAYFNV
ncbi:uridylate-specific endoribonuclease-like [Diadema setosum]|uniref:uridylate-specific endoribonuclease-like n=1 Tax=Diadema setosum TaxID=31175 RepID=UPI003B3B6892